MTIFTAKNILKAYKLARKSRKKKQEVFLFDLHFEENILEILKSLKERNYKHWEYKQIILIDSKKRYIFSPHFRDHILHHLAYAQIYNMLDSKMTHTTFACRKWYGSHRWILYLKKIIKKERRKHKNEKLYYLKIDFSKYFFSINHEILKEKIRKYIQDEELLYLLDVIIDSYKSPKIYDSLLKNNFFYICEENKWLPIWWIISQILANFYLNDLDQYLKHKLKIRFVRYMDDIVMIWNKKKLNYVRDEIIEFIKQDKLILNPKKISLNLVNDGVNFVWYKIINDKIFVWKKIKKSYLKFTDYLEKFKPKANYLNTNDLERIKSMYFSRTWTFKITSYWEKYISKRGNTDFIRGANANNGAHAGVFTLNLNRSTANQNRNVGFRCS